MLIPEGIQFGAYDAFVRVLTFVHVGALATQMRTIIYNLPHMCSILLDFTSFSGNLKSI